VRSAVQQLLRLRKAAVALLSLEGVMPATDAAPPRAFHMQEEMWDGGGIDDVVVTGRLVLSVRDQEEGRGHLSPDGLRILRQLHSSQSGRHPQQRQPQQQRGIQQRGGWSGGGGVGGAGFIPRGQLKRRATHSSLSGARRDGRRYQRRAQRTLAGTTLSSAWRREMADLAAAERAGASSPGEELLYMLPGDLTTLESFWWDGEQQGAVDKTGGFTAARRAAEPGVYTMRSLPSVMSPPTTTRHSGSAAGAAAPRQGRGGGGVVAARRRRSSEEPLGAGERPEPGGRRRRRPLRADERVETDEEARRRIGRRNHRMKAEMARARGPLSPPPRDEAASGDGGGGGGAPAVAALSTGCPSSSASPGEQRQQDGHGVGSAAVPVPELAYELMWPGGDDDGESLPALSTARSGGSRQSSRQSSRQGSRQSGRHRGLSSRGSAGLGTGRRRRRSSSRGEGGAGAGASSPVVVTPHRPTLGGLEGRLEWFQLYARDRTTREAGELGRPGPSSQKASTERGGGGGGGKRIATPDSARHAFLQSCYEPKQQEGVGRSAGSTAVPSYWHQSTRADTTVLPSRHVGRWRRRSPSSRSDQQQRRRRQQAAASTPSSSASLSMRRPLPSLPLPLLAHCEPHQASGLMQLNLSHMQLDDRMMQHLAAALPRLAAAQQQQQQQQGGGAAAAGCCCPEDIDLSHNGLIGEPGVLAIAGALSRCPPVRRLNLSGCNLGGGVSAPERLATMLRGHGCQLQALGLSGCQLGDRAATTLVVALEASPTLAHLDLSRNGLGGAMMRMRIEPSRCSPARLACGVWGGAAAGARAEFAG
jgi:hypothetical protein